MVRSAGQSFPSGEGLPQTLPQLSGEVLDLSVTTDPAFQTQAAREEDAQVEVKEHPVHPGPHIRRAGKDPEVDVLDPIPKGTDVYLGRFEHVSERPAGVLPVRVKRRESSAPANRMIETFPGCTWARGSLLPLRS